MNHTIKHLLLFLASLCALVIPFWSWYVAPHLLAVPDYFSYSANLVSYDNFYDPVTEIFTGKTESSSKFTYQVVSVQPGVLIIKNLFNVVSAYGEDIIQVERLYGINPVTGRHVIGFGDHDRTGYLFAPRHLRPNENFTYWHVNYDVPAELHYKNTEVIDGLTVFHYQTTLNPDQTTDLGQLPNVGETLGINLDVVLNVWVEPLTGRMVKYSDKAVGYYYDLGSRKRLQPWNSFSNRFTDNSITTQVEIAKQERNFAILVEWIVPAALVVMLLCLLTPFVVTHWYLVERLRRIAFRR